MILLTDPCYKFEKLLRKLEYYTNCKAGVSKLYIIWLRKKFQKLSVALGITIPINIFGPGLCILHYGSIVVSRHAKVGNNCTINSGVNIGANPNQAGSATIGNNCYIGPGAKIFGDICIGNNVKIGANTVVNKSFNEDNITIAGIPGEIVKK